MPDANPGKHRRKLHPRHRPTNLPTSRYLLKKIEEVEKAWETSPIEGFEGSRFYWDLTSEVDYYGTHGDCVVMQTITLYGGDTGWHSSTSEIAGIKTFSRHLYYFVVYHDGAFFWLQDAYDQGWLTKDNLLSIHKRFESKYPGDVKVSVDE